MFDSPLCCVFVVALAFLWKASIECWTSLSSLVVLCACVCIGTCFHVGVPIWRVFFSNFVRVRCRPVFRFKVRKFQGWVG